MYGFMDSRQPMAYNGPSGAMTAHRNPQSGPFPMGTEQAHKPIRFQHDTGGANGPHDPMRRRPPNEQPMAGNSYDVPLMELARENIVLKHQLHTAQLEMDRLKSLVAAREAKEEDMPAQPRYWTDDEHERFLDALEKFGHKDVKAIANYVGTRNATQVRSHAQKYFMKLAREGKLSDDHNEQDAVGEGSSASGGENPGAQSACEEYKPTSKVDAWRASVPPCASGGENPGAQSACEEVTNPQFSGLLKAEIQFFPNYEGPVTLRRIVASLFALPMQPLSDTALGTQYKPTSKVRRLEGVRPALRNGNESSTSLSSGASRCSNLGGGWQPQGDSADSCSSTSGTSGTNMEDFFDNNTTDAVAGWQTDDSIPRNLKARSSQARRSSGGQARGEPEEALAQTESELPDSKCTY
eukprot:CAMPEP_0202852942 /NCGR_PEP_ID=MMETSP1389-20130828/90227_1 /ASSEMBLY_ACC=CAM_ASM_000865 /TAXON_ID=302021 /ORGANISM="Rhodomonas sp., Strain CCMP768" /LENGTH=409 /DNA_ID=CAMNT_0049531477 /DNA_START=181 /DNA_END=1412 /DNA_ORIENTATION=+